jgi:DNA polymerase
MTYMTDDKIWKRQEARGSFLVENAVQGIARDLLVNGMIEADAAGFVVVLHVHDELVAEVPLTSELTYAIFEECMTTNPHWGPDIPLKVEGGEMTFYRKG